jgi:hypothetical protein
MILQPHQLDQGPITTLVGKARDQAELAGVLNTLETVEKVQRGSFGHFYMK